MTIHVVCRDCTFEALTEDTDEAVRMVDSHESETGHNVDDGRVDSEARLVTDGGKLTLALTDDGLEIPEDVSLADGVVVRARGATVDHKPGSEDRPFYPMIDERALRAEDREVINEQLDEDEVTVKQYGQNAETYRVVIPKTDGGTLDQPEEAIDYPPAPEVQSVKTSSSEPGNPTQVEIDVEFWTHRRAGEPLHSTVTFLTRSEPAVIRDVDGGGCLVDQLSAIAAAQDALADVPGVDEVRTLEEEFENAVEYIGDCREAADE